VGSRMAQLPPYFLFKNLHKIHKILKSDCKIVGNIGLQIRKVSGCLPQTPTFRGLYHWTLFMAFPLNPLWPWPQTNLLRLELDQSSMIIKGLFTSPRLNWTPSFVISSFVSIDGLRQTKMRCFVGT